MAVPAEPRAEGANLIEPAQLLAESAVRDVLVRCLILLAILVAGLVAVLWLRRRMQSGGSSAGPDVQSFEEMHRSGLISDEEFRRLRNTALGVKDTPATGKSGSSGPPPGDDDKTDDAPEADGPSARQQRDQRET